MDSNDVIIPDLENFNSILKNIKESGVDNLQVVADFDKTLTTAFIDGKHSPSTIGQLREGNFLPDEYVQKAHKFFDIYHPVEISTELSRDYRMQKMEEWWRKHYQLLIDYKLSKSVFNEVIKSRSIRFRAGALELIDLLKEKSIPLVIMSAGLGDLIKGALEQEGRMYENVYIISNYFEFDESGFAVTIKEPIIHSMNKNEIVLKSFSFYEGIEKRKNIIMLGDNMDDVGMVKGMDYENLIKIGFLN